MFIINFIFKFLQIKEKLWERVYESYYYFLWFQRQRNEFFTNESEILFLWFLRKTKGENFGKCSSFTWRFLQKIGVISKKNEKNFFKVRLRDMAHSIRCSFLNVKKMLDRYFLNIVFFSTDLNIYKTVI